MSSFGYWIALTISYTGLHLLLLHILSPGTMEVVASREYGPQLLVSAVFAIVNCLQTFVVAISTTLLARWWLGPEIPSLTLLFAVILPPLIIIQLLRLAGESGLVVSIPELIVNMVIALSTAYAAVFLGLRLTLTL
jgi:hypothetical protein